MSEVRHLISGDLTTQVPVRLSCTLYLMGEPKEIIIFKKAYELSLEAFRCTKLFPKSQRFLMAHRLEELTIAILEKIIQANEARNKLGILNELSALLERLRIL